MIAITRAFEVVFFSRVIEPCWIASCVEKEHLFVGTFYKCHDHFDPWRHFGWLNHVDWFCSGILKIVNSYCSFNCNISKTIMGWTNILNDRKQGNWLMHSISGANRKLQIWQWYWFWSRGLWLVCQRESWTTKVALSKKKQNLLKTLLTFDFNLFEPFEVAFF